MKHIKMNENQWLYPNEVEKNSDGNFITKKDKKKVVVGHLKLCPNQEKIS